MAVNVTSDPPALLAVLVLIGVLAYVFLRRGTEAFEAANERPVYWRTA